MKNMLFDLSAKLELQPLAEVVRPLQQEATKLEAQVFLMGAAARDVMLLHAYGIDTVRLTEDMDFGVMVRDWATFEALRDALLANGAFEARSKDATHKLWHKSANRWTSCRLVAWSGPTARWPGRLASNPCSIALVCKRPCVPATTCAYPVAEAFG